PGTGHQASVVDASDQAGEHASRLGELVSQPAVLRLSEITQLLVAVRLGYLGESEHRGLRDKLAETGRVLAGLIRSIDN
ncbi:MAG: hypothetical protein AAGI17_04325, partial [Planctomycetota bacterium]